MQGTHSSLGADGNLNFVELLSTAAWEVAVDEKVTAVFKHQYST